MYIARTSEIITTDNGLEVKFYVLDEDNNYNNMGGVRLTFPINTSIDEIHKSIVSSIKDKYIKNNGKLKHTDEEIKKAGIQPFIKPVIRFQDKLNGVS